MSSEDKKFIFLWFDKLWKKVFTLTVFFQHKYQPLLLEKTKRFGFGISVNFVFWDLWFSEWRPDF